MLNISVVQVAARKNYHAHVLHALLESSIMEVNILGKSSIAYTTKSQCIDC